MPYTHLYSVHHYWWEKAGVAPEVNLRNPLSTGEGIQARESTLALKPRADVTRSPKQGYQWPHKKDLCPTKMFKKNVLNPYLSKRFF